MKTPALLLIPLILAGCATLTPEERAAKVEREVDEMIRIYGPACEKLGFQSDSDPWRNCVLRLSADERSLQYINRPTTTSCVGRRGFFHCTTF
jgi:hypothetical protein